MLYKQMEAWGSRLFRWRSYLPLLLAPFCIASLGHFSYPFEDHLLDIYWELICFAIAGSGLALRGMTVGFVPKGTSGRNTRRIKAQRLNTTGVYSIVRHPLYLGNFLVFMSFVLFLRDGWLTLLMAVVYWVYYERIMLAEERLLAERFGEGFRAWAVRTPAILPRPRLWSAPELSFCWRTVLKREYTTVFLVIAAMTALEVSGDYIIFHHLELDVGWAILFACGLLFYLTIRVIHRMTDWLRVEGR